MTPGEWTGALSLGIIAVCGWRGVRDLIGKRPPPPVEYDAAHTARMEFEVYGRIVSPSLRDEFGDRPPPRDPFIRTTHRVKGGYIATAPAPLRPPPPSGRGSASHPVFVTPPDRPSPTRGERR